MARKPYLLKRPMVGEMFCRYLLGLRKDSQVVIVENEHPPEFVTDEANVIIFTKNPHQGRYGFFPVD